MTGMEVYTCQDVSDESCSKRGVFGKVGRSSWGTVTCNKRASFIKVQHPSEKLTMAEVEVYGQGTVLKFRSKILCILSLLKQLKKKRLSWKV